MKKVLLIFILALYNIPINAQYTLLSNQKCKELFTYCKNNGYNTNYVILVDFSRPLYKDRLFLYDLATNSRWVEVSSYVGQGIGKHGESFITPKFSNKPNSWLSSKGKYKLGKVRKLRKYNIPCIELYGLDSSNSNTYKRGIVIHPGPIWSQGCFSIDNTTFNQLVYIKKTSKLPILLYAF